MFRACVPRYNFAPMSWTVVLRPREMEAFRRCRREWDLGSGMRQSYVPIAPTRVFDFDKALHDAFAVYYFPAMDDWSRGIVRPLALQGFHRSMRESRAIYEKTASLTADQEREWNEHIELGEKVLEGYFEWAAEVDDFASIFADEDLWTHIPDPWNPGHALAMPDGRSLRYLGRVDQLISDPNDEFWVVDHRITNDGFSDSDELLLDMVSLSYAWALELCYPQLKIAGTIHNELRTDAHDRGGGATQEPRLDERDERDMGAARHISIRRSPATPLEGGQDAEDQTAVIKQEQNARFRRTRIRRSRASIQNIGTQIAMQALEMRSPDVRIYPNPSETHCPSCVYRKPCIAMSTGLDFDSILATEYRTRGEEELEEERLRWSKTRQKTPAALGSTAWRSNPRL